MNFIKNILFWLPTALWYRLIWSFSAQTAAVSGGASDGLLEQLLSALCPAYGAAVPDVQRTAVELLSFYIRKAAHMFLYFVLALLVWLALTRLLRVRPKRACAALVLCALLAALDEYHQTLVPGRSGELRDILIDLIGAGIALLLFALPPLSVWLRRSLTHSEWLWPLGLLPGGALMLYPARLTAPAPLFARRAEALEFFLQLPSGESEALLQAASPILREGLFLFLAAATGFCIVCLSFPSPRWRDTLVASGAALLLTTLIALVWTLPLLPALLVSFGATAVGWLLRSLFPLLRR